MLLYKNTPTSSESFLILGCCPRSHYVCFFFFSFFIILLPPSRFVRLVSIFYSSPTTYLILLSYIPIHFAVFFCLLSPVTISHFILLYLTPLCYFCPSLFCFYRFLSLPLLFTKDQCRPTPHAAISTLFFPLPTFFCTDVVHPIILPRSDL